MSLPNHIRIKIFGNFQPKIGLDDWLVNNVYKQIMIQLVTLGEIHTWTTIAGDMWGRRLSERVCDQQLITPPVVPPWTESGLTGSRLEWKKTRTWLPFENWSDRRASGLKESNYFGRSMRIREREVIRQDTLVFGDYESRNGSVVHLAISWFANRPQWLVQAKLRNALTIGLHWTASKSRRRFFTGIRVGKIWKRKPNLDLWPFKRLPNC